MPVELLVSVSDPPPEKLFVPPAVFQIPLLIIVGSGGAWAWAWAKNQPCR